MKRTKSVVPTNPAIGALWNEPATGTLRVWSGAIWWETSPREIAAKIKQYGSLRKWIAAEFTEGKPNNG